MKVILLGTGGPRPDPKHAATTTLIRVGDDNVLFDAGRGVVVQMAKASIPLDRVNPVLLTHHHFDHIGDLYDVMLNSWMPAYRVRHGDGLGFPPAFLQRWMCYGYRFEAEGKVVAISGDTVDCEGLSQLAHGADLLMHCCYMASAEIEDEQFRRVVQHTLAGGDTVGKIAARAGAKILALTHHRPRRDQHYLQILAEEVARDFAGRVIVGEDLTEIEV